MPAHFRHDLLPAAQSLGPHDDLVRLRRPHAFERRRGMNVLEPRLQRLREIEARLAFAEYHLQDQRALVAQLTHLGLANSLDHSLLRSMEDAVAILRLRRRDILRSLEAAPPSRDAPMSSTHDARRGR